MLHKTPDQTHLLSFLSTSRGEGKWVGVVFRIGTVTGNSPLQGGHREDALSLVPCRGEWHKGTQGHQRREKETSGLEMPFIIPPSLGWKC